MPNSTIPGKPVSDMTNEEIKTEIANINTEEFKKLKARISNLQTHLKLRIKYKIIK